MSKFFSFIFSLLFCFQLTFLNCLEEKPCSFSWDNLSFSVTPTNKIYSAECLLEGDWHSKSLLPYGSIKIDPSSCVLNYGQGIFEGLKAYRTIDGRIVLFRPNENAKRFQRGSKRLGMPLVSEEMFISAIKETVLANQEWIPPSGMGTLYIRPLLLGTGTLITLMPAPSYSFLVFVTPVGNYFKGEMKAIDLMISEDIHRAHPGGTGDIKAISNYSAGFVPLKNLKEKGFAEFLYLDVTNKYVEEVGAANFFCVKDDVLYTPELSGTILPGITRDSIITLARDLGYTVSEQKVDLDLVFSSDEAFCCGTAAVISPIGSITYKDQKITYYNKEVGPVTKQLFELLSGIQQGKIPDRFSWLEEVSQSE